MKKILMFMAIMIAVVLLLVAAVNQRFQKRHLNNYEQILLQR